MGKITIPTTCPYCGGEVVKTTNAEIYGREYGKYPTCYLCRGCRASVGTHPSGEPLGVLADRELKVLKVKAHNLLDRYWKEKGWGRHTAYKKLSKKMNMPASDCHIGYFDKETTLEAIAILESPNGLYLE